jgi:hypothetical protein
MNLILRFTSINFYQVHYWNIHDYFVLISFIILKCFVPGYLFLFRRNLQGFWSFWNISEIRLRFLLFLLFFYLIVMSFHWILSSYFTYENKMSPHLFLFLSFLSERRHLSFFILFFITFLTICEKIALQKLFPFPDCLLWS